MPIAERHVRNNLFGVSVLQTLVPSVVPSGPDSVALRKSSYRRETCSGVAYAGGKSGRWSVFDAVNSSTRTRLPLFYILTSRINGEG